MFKAVTVTHQRMLFYHRKRNFLHIMQLAKCQTKYNGNKALPRSDRKIKTIYQHDGNTICGMKVKGSDPGDRRIFWSST
jgi:hypothetical protein